MDYKLVHEATRAYKHAAVTDAWTRFTGEVTVCGLTKKTWIDHSVVNATPVAGLVPNCDACLFAKLRQLDAST